MKRDHAIPILGTSLAAATLIGACLWNPFRDLDDGASARQIFATGPDSSNRANSSRSDEKLLFVQDIKSANVHPDEPFHTRSNVTPEGHLSYKWQPVARAIRDELDIVAACAQAPDKCSSSAALKFLSITAEASKYEGRARLGNVNRAVNLAVKYTTDSRKHGIPDHWATPFETLGSGTGDCEDYAITKYALLRALNWPMSDLRIVLVWDNRSRDYHAVEATFLTPDWLILDNGTLIISAANKLPNYHPLFIIDKSSIRQLKRPAAGEKSKIANWSRLE